MYSDPFWQGQLGSLACSVEAGGPAQQEEEPRSGSTMAAPVEEKVEAKKNLWRTAMM